MLTIKTAKLVKWVQRQTTLSSVALPDTKEWSLILVVSFPLMMETSSHPSWSQTPAFLSQNEHIGFVYPAFKDKLKYIISYIVRQNKLMNKPT